MSLNLFHRQVGLNIKNLLCPLKDRSRPGIQLSDDPPGLLHLSRRDIQLGCDSPVVAARQRFQMVPDDSDGGAGLANALQLERQALRQL